MLTCVWAPGCKPAYTARTSPGVAVMVWYYYMHASDAYMLDQTFACTHLLVPPHGMW